MVERAAFVCVLVFLLCYNYGALSSDLNQRLLPNIFTSNGGIIVDFVSFRNFRKENGTLLADYEIESNDIGLEIPRAGTVKERTILGEVDFGLEDQITIKLSDVQPGGTNRRKYDLIINHSVVVNKTNEHQSTVKEVPLEQKKNDYNEILFRKQSTEVSKLADSDENKSIKSIPDDVVDFLLQIVRDMIHQSGRDQIAIPDVDEKFSTEIVFIPVTGRFRAQDGWFKNLSTIYRTGEVEITASLHEITVEFDLGLRTIEFGYRYYDAELGAMGASGSLAGSIASDSIATQITLTYVNKTCKARLDSLRVKVLQDIHVTLTGWDGFGWLLSFIANCVSGSYRDQIIHAVEQALSHTLIENLDKFNCEHLFPS